jgi:glutaredoxin 3
MKITREILLLFVLSVFAASCGAADVKKPAPAVSAAAVQNAGYPKIVLYSVDWCSHCTEAKGYLKSRNIPFTNRDVEQDEDAMDRLLNVYKTQTVPVIVIGDEKAVLKGFDPKEFEEAVRKVRDR